MTDHASGRGALRGALPALFDRVLDWAVVPGYTSIGYGLRRRSWNGELGGRPLAGRTVLVTGASSGIGEAAAEGLARLGAGVHMLARDPERGAAARDRVAARIGVDRGRAPTELELEVCDLSDLEAVRAFAARFAAANPRLDGLVHNAGVMPPRRERSAQGHELAFATNVLGPFLLTNLLLPALRRSAPSTVALVASGGMYTAGLDVDDLELDRREFDGPRFYAHTKRIEVILAKLWAERERGTGVAFASLHPGWVDTPGLERSLPGFRRLLRPLLRDPAQGADTAVWLLATSAAHGRPGAFWHDRRPRPEHRLPWTRESETERRRLWAELARRSGSIDERDNHEGE
ncbi:MAG TPA: SDR family NAD(P)-dependent oxidoreductase [Solirubrobacterales bacterium]|nr:SDR family NAD(P)-dependent oxidoreductase [Solirubrobacterales bacterium]